MVLVNNVFKNMASKIIKNKKILFIVIGIVLLFTIATLSAAVIIKYSYHKSFVKECYRVCYYSKVENIWEYRPWGYNVEYTEENRDFPKMNDCLAYCLSQKQIDFIK
jgi:hypothetical protein